MRRAAILGLHATHRALLRVASLIVPEAQRMEWYREWTCELCHARLTRMPGGAFTWIAAHELTAFCLGSFQDAVCLRRMQRETPVPSASMHGSARQCVLWMCAVLALCALIARFLPGIPCEDDAARNRVPSGLLLIARMQDDDGLSPSIPFDDFRDWASRRQQFFTRLAFYWTERRSGKDPVEDRRSLVIAHASESLVDVLGVEFAREVPAAETDAQVPPAILSRSMWRRNFASNPALFGEKVTVANRRVRIVGVAPEGTGRLPDNPDLWILEPETTIARESLAASGFVIAQLSPAGRMQMTGDATSISTLDRNGDPVELRGVAFTAPASGTAPIYLFALFLAVLALPAVTSVFNSESNFASHRPSFATRMKCWVFLTAKFGLIAAVGYFAALDIAYSGFAEYSPTAEFLQFAATFSLCLFGLRWALMDQSRRCPVCLRRVTHPAQVGIASCSFLGWNGTEMICMGGHALLHVPNLPTSWFSRQRWMYLDTSWDFLFADAVGRS